MSEAYWARIVREDGQVITPIECLALEGTDERNRKKAIIFPTWRMGKVEYSPLAQEYPTAPIFVLTKLEDFEIGEYAGELTYIETGGFISKGYFLLNGNDVPFEWGGK